MEGMASDERIGNVRFNTGSREYGKTAKELVKGQEKLLEKLQDMRFDLSKTEREITRVINQVKTSQFCMSSFLDKRGSRSARDSDESYTSEYTYTPSPRYSSVCENLQYRNLRHIARKHGSNNPSCVYQYNTENSTFSKSHYVTKTSTPRSDSARQIFDDEDLSPRLDQTPSMYGSTSEYSEDEEEFLGPPAQTVVRGKSVRFRNLSEQSSVTTGSDVSDASSLVTVSTTSTLHDSNHSISD